MGKSCGAFPLMCTFVIGCSFIWFMKASVCVALANQGSQASVISSASVRAHRAIMSFELLPRVNDSETVTDHGPDTVNKTLGRLGDQCFYVFDCLPSDNSICVNGRCTCPYGYYEFRSSHQNPAVCREEKKYGEKCDFQQDCQAHDANTVCKVYRAWHMCVCLTQTQFVRHLRKCYKLEKQIGESCEFNEQCHVPNGYKCYCDSQCYCTSIVVPPGPIKIENILIGVFATMVILIGAHISIFYVRRRIKASRQQCSETSEEPTGTVPSAPLEEEYPPMTILHPNVSPEVTITLPRDSNGVTNVSDPSDLPPPYESVAYHNKRWNVPPPEFKDAKQYKTLV